MSSHAKPFLAETPQARAASRSHTLKRATTASVTLHSMGKAGAIGAGGSTARTAPLVAGSSDKLSGFSGASQVNDVLFHGAKDQLVAPPDPDVAVGPSDIVETVNSSIYVYNRAGALIPGGTADLNTFLSVDSTHSSSDPRIIYDARSQRWWLTITEDPVPFDCTNFASPVLIAVSASSNPLPFSSWRVYALPFQSSSALLGDQPGLGVSNDTLAVSFDDYDCSGNFLQSEIDILQKSDLELNTGLRSDVIFHGNEFAPQPVQSLGSTNAQYVVTNESDCAPTVCTTPQIEVDAFTGNPEANNVVVTPAFPAMTPTLVDPALNFGLPSAQQSGTSHTLNTDDDRFLNAVWGNGMIWTAGGTECMPTGDSTQRSCLDYVGVTADSGGTVGPTVTQINNVGVNGSYLYYPALSMDSSGNVVTVFNESSSSSFPAIMDATIASGGSTLSTFQTLHTSSTFYDPNSSGVCQPVGTPTACRWGDYNGAALDPSNPQHVWVVAEAEDGATTTSGFCSTQNACWGSDVELVTLAQPVITSLNAAYGPVVGGQTVTVDGTDFGVDTTVTFNASPITIHNLTPTSFTFVTPPSGGTATTTAQVQATDPAGSSVEDAASLYTYLGLSNYTTVPPFRILDTRTGTCVQCSNNPTFGPGVTETLHLVGVTGLSVTDPIPSNATAVVLNVTEVAGTASSLLTVYPSGTSLRPVVSNLNFPPGKVISNLVTVTLGTGGAVNIYNALGSVNVLADVEGYFTPQLPSVFQGLFHPITPVRVCDTRKSCEGHVAVGPGRSIVVRVATTGGIPSDGTAGAAVVNLTGVAGSGSTYLSLFPTDSSGACHPTGTSTINLLPGAVAANRVMVQLGPTTSGGPDVALCVFNAVGSINVIVDANGWYGSGTATASPTGYQYQALSPIRICDTRFASTSCSPGAIAAGTTLQRLITVSGHAGVPTFGGATTVVAMIANLTGVAPTAATYLALYPANLSSPPGVSDLNLGAGAVVPNLAVVKVDTLPSDAHDGDVYLYNGAGSANAILDLEGWFQ
ncbi:MAG: IPT/TIG domain-containing protein [Candidatus Dormiibacterota bacterium]